MTLGLGTIARADVVPFQWSTSGSWSDSASHPGLTFTGVSTSSVTNTNANGNLDIDLGTFNLNSGGFSGNPPPGSFTLSVNFWRPSTIVGGTAQTFSASFDGSTTFFGSDTYSIDFSGSPRTITFNGADGTGSFQFTVQDVSLNTAAFFTSPDLSESLTGQIRNADVTSGAVPEPQSVLLLCTAVAGAGLVARRKLLA